MDDPANAHVTRIYVNCPRSSPSPIRSTNTMPVCTSTPIVSVPSLNCSPQQKMALIAKEILASQRASETFTQKAQTPPQNIYQFISKTTRQPIDFNTGEGLGKIIPMSQNKLPKKKKRRQTLAVVPPAVDSARASKSNNDGDNLVPLTDELRINDEKKKSNFTSYDGLQMFTFTLDDD